MDGLSVWDDRIHQQMQACLGPGLHRACPALPSGTVPSVGTPQVCPAEVWACSPKSLFGFMPFGAVLYGMPL